MRYILLVALFFFANVCAKTVQEIEQEIQTLETEIQNLSKEEFNAEMEGQDDFLDNQAAFVKKIEEAKKLSVRISDLKAEVNALKEKK